jgi:hypothetical protein
MNKVTALSVLSNAVLVWSSVRFAEVVAAWKRRPAKRSPPPTSPASRCSRARTSSERNLSFPASGRPLAWVVRSTTHRAAIVARRKRERIHTAVGSGSPLDNEIQRRL